MTDTTSATEAEAAGLALQRLLDAGANYVVIHTDFPTTSPVSVTAHRFAIEGGASQITRTGVAGGDSVLAALDAALTNYALKGTE